MGYSSNMLVRSMNITYSQNGADKIVHCIAQPTEACTGTAHTSTQQCNNKAIALNLRKVYSINKKVCTYRYLLVIILEQTLITMTYGRTGLSMTHVHNVIGMGRHACQTRH